VTRRLTKEYRAELRARDDHDVVYPHEVKAMLDDIDAADAEIADYSQRIEESNSRLVRTNAEQANEIERLRKALEREKAKVRILSTFSEDIAGARTSREIRLAEEKAMTALRALDKGGDSA
jgi:predicted RNase H-like nuclease (RuvC/YqgF family)